MSARGAGVSRHAQTTTRYFDKALFEGRHFDREVIILCVRWYLRFKLSL
jgi:transposase-like protein